MAKRILVVEDDPVTATLIQHALEKEAYRVQVAETGQQGLEAFRESAPDLVVLDRILPDISGIDVCQKIREDSDVAILMLTKKAEVAERVEGLDAGASDYLPKPFHIEEFLARVRAQLRIPHPRANEHQLVYGDLVLDIYSRKAQRNGEALSFSGKEYELLLYFMNHVEEVLSKPHLLKAVWEWDYKGEDNIIEVYIHNLRKKLHLPGLPKILHTVRGAGYTLKLEQKK